MTVEPTDDARNDVTQLNCSWKTDQYLTTATVNVRIVNHTDSAQSYSVDVELSNAQDHPVATAFAFAQSVSPTGTVTATGTGFPSGPVPGMRCHIGNVIRVPGSAGGSAPSGGGASHVDLPHVYVPHPDLDPFHIHLHIGHGHK